MACEFPAAKRLGRESSVIWQQVVLVIAGLLAGACWLGVWVELALGARFNTRYFRLGPCLLRFSQVFGVRAVESEIKDLLQHLPSLATKRVAPDTILIRERLGLLGSYLDVAPVSFSRIWLVVEDTNASTTVHMEVRPHISWLLFLLIPVTWAGLVFATNPVPSAALFLGGFVVLFVGLFWLQLRATKKRARRLWERIVAAIEASPERH